MKRKRYFKLMHINLTKDLNDYLNWKSDKINRSVSEIIRFLIREDLKKNKSLWMKDITNEYDALTEPHRIQG